MTAATSRRISQLHRLLSRQQTLLSRRNVLRPWLTLEDSQWHLMLLSLQRDCWTLNVSQNPWFLWKCSITSLCREATLPLSATFFGQSGSLYMAFGGLQTMSRLQNFSFQLNPLNHSRFWYHLLVVWNIDEKRKKYTKNIRKLNHKNSHKKLCGKALTMC